MKRSTPNKQKGRKPSRRELDAARAAAADQKLAASSAPARGKQLIACFGVYSGPISSEEAQRRLVAMGADAVAALADALDDPKNGWQAAMTLAQIGAPDSEAALDRLLHHARITPASPSARWSMTALARLARFDELFALLDDPGKIELAISALAAVTPRSYPWLDRALGRKDKAIRSAVADALRPGRGRFFEPGADELELVVAGARSLHAAVRMDAAILLRAGPFPRSTRAQTAGVLAELLRDSSSEVRRLAALSLGYVGKRLAPIARQALAVALADRNAKVREAAAYAQQRLAK